MKTQNNKLVALIEMHASANENGHDALCNALYHAINELAKTIGYKGENACDELSANGELEIDGVCYQFDGKTILTVNTMKTYRIETMTTEQESIIRTACASIRSAYGKGGTTQEWKELDRDFLLWQRSEFGRALFASELEAICA